MQSSYFPYVPHTYFLLYQLKVSSSLIQFYEAIIDFQVDRLWKQRKTECNWYCCS